MGDYARVLRRGWGWILAGVVLCVGAAFLANTLLPREYEAEVTIYIEGRADGEYPVAVLEAAQAQMPTYRQLLTEDRVLGDVIGRLGLDESPAELRGRLVVGNEADTLLLKLRATDGAPQQAASIANAVAVSFVEVASDLDTPRVAGEERVVSARIVQEAQIPTGVVSPQLSTNYALGLVAGLALGVAAAFVRAVSGRRIRSVGDLAEATTVPGLGILAVRRSTEPPPLLGPDGNPTDLWADFRQLAANLRMVDLAHITKAVVLTSAHATSMTTTTALNLALALTEGGSRVVLVDADLRRPATDDIIALEPHSDARTEPPSRSIGLTSVLTKQVPLQEAVRSWARDPRLDVLPAGRRPPNPLEFVSSPQMTSLIEELRLRYDFVVFDAPPLGEAEDAAVLAAKMDGALLCCLSGRTGSREVRRALEALETASASLLGTVMVVASRRKRGATADPPPADMTCTHVNGVSPADAALPTMGSGTR